MIACGAERALALALEYLCRSPGTDTVLPCDVAFLTFFLLNGKMGIIIPLQPVNQHYWEHAMKWWVWSSLMEKLFWSLLGSLLLISQSIVINSSPPSFCPVEHHLASNIQRNRLVQHDLRVAKQLQEEDLKAQAQLQKRYKDLWGFWGVEGIMPGLVYWFSLWSQQPGQGRRRGSSVPLIPVTVRFKKLCVCACVYMCVYPCLFFDLKTWFLEHWLGFGMCAFWCELLAFHCMTLRNLVHPFSFRRRWEKMISAS